MLQDYKLGLRMLLKYPGLTIAGGLTLAVAIGIGAVWYEMIGQITAVMPVPEGDRVVAIETRNVLTNEIEMRVARDFLEWRRELRTIADLGAFRPVARNLTVRGQVPGRIQMADITAAAFRTARVAPLLGRGLLDSDETPGSPIVVVLGYDVWQRAFGARPDVLGSEVTLGDTAATVVGVMPDGFGYPFNYHAWAPLQLRASYGPLEGGVLSVIGRLAPGVTRAQADAEVHALGERASAALPATHEHLRSRVTRPDEPGDSDNGELSRLVEFVVTNLPVLLVLTIACTSVGTLVYARTAVREGEIALRSAIGATRARIIGQLFAEALVLAAVAAALGLNVADRLHRWGLKAAYSDEGGPPFWMTPGLSLSTMVYAAGLAIVCAAMLSLLPALRVTRVRVQSHLASLGSGGATLRFGRVWTGAMILQVALTTLGVPAAMESTSQTIVRDRIRARFPSRDYFAARIDIDVPLTETASASIEARRARAYAELARRVAQEPGVVAVAFADRTPGGTPSRHRVADIEPSPGAGVAFDYGFGTSAVEPGFFDLYARSIVAGRAFNNGDVGPAARSVIVNEAFVRGFALRGGRGSPLGARLRYADRSGTPAAVDAWYDIVGIVRDFGLDPTDEGDEPPQVFHAASAATMSGAMMHVRVRGTPAPLVSRVPLIAADLDAGLSVQDPQSLDEWIRQRSEGERLTAIIFGSVTLLVLILSSLGIFSLVSVSVARRTREIGLRTALGATPRQVLAILLSRVVLVVVSGVLLGAGPGLLLPFDVGVASMGVWLVVSAVVMLTAGTLASIVPARRALRINPTEALREA